MCMSLNSVAVSQQFEKELIASLTLYSQLFQLVSNLYNEQLLFILYNCIRVLLEWGHPIVADKA
jgi:hypothetical protein